MNSRHLTGAALLVAGVATGSLWASGRIAHPFTPVVALLLLLAGASFFAATGRFADRLRPFVGKRVRVRIWGSELPDHEGRTFVLQSVLSLGPGLHLYLGPLPDGSALHLKIAQPLEASAGATGAEIGRAKYVQWRGKKIKKNASEKAFVMLVEAD